MRNSKPKPKMAETQPPETESTRARLPISIPFLWEEKPGTPKKDWKPSPLPITIHNSPPVKLVISIPFVWEEKPGTPLQSYSFSSHEGPNGAPLLSSDSDSSDTCSFKTSTSFGSDGMISLANGISTHVVKEEGARGVEESGRLEGANFLEWLFPLLVPSSSVSRKDEILEERGNGEEFMSEGSSSRVRRPLLTLGELIVMSRRRSCRRKVDRMRKQASMELMRRNGWGGCLIIFGSSNWKKQLGLRM